MRIYLTGVKIRCYVLQVSTEGGTASPAGTCWAARDDWRAAGNLSLGTRMQRRQINLSASSSGIDYAQGGVMIYGNDQSYLKLGVFASSNTRQVECFRQVSNPPAGQTNYGSIPLGPPGDDAWMRRAKRTVSGHGQYTAHSSQDGFNSAADREIKNTSARCQLRKSVLATTMCVALTLGPAARGQEAASEKAGPKNQQSGMGGGASTGGAHAPVKDALSRPITAGGFVDGAPIVFADITHQAGLDKFHHRSGSYEKNSILETPGSGVALLDYDNDGWLDIFLLNGSTFRAFKGLEPPPRAMLLHNNRDGTFTDVTEKAGVPNERWGFGVAIGDYDNDGWPDIYVANYGKNRLYHNNHDGTFTDVAEKAGVALGGWSAGPTWGDYDHDGLLDLFVPGYVKFDIDNPPAVGKNGMPASLCQFRGANVMCGPRGLTGESDHLFHNNGDGTFTDVSVKAGVSDPRGYYGFASVFVDLDDDGWVDLAVANDSVPKYLYRNRHDGTFEDISYMSGFALNDGGREQASMGIGVGDYDHDGKVDLVITNFSDDYDTLYRNDGDAIFSDVSFQAGIAEPTIPFLGWGAGFLDYDNDGLLDIFFANGHVYPGVDKQDWGTTWAQRPLLFRNLDGKKFQEVPPATGSGLAVVAPARGAAFGDLFNDGHMDVVMNNIDTTPTLLRNMVRNGNHWICFRLVGGPKSPRDAIGAKVFVTAGGFRQRADIFSGGSYGSSSDMRPQFGLGGAVKIDKIEIHWPDGAREEVTAPEVDRIFTVIEGKGIQAKLL